VTCTGVVKDEKTGEVVELRCTYDPETRGGGSPDGRQVKATLHWVSAPHAVNAEVRLYDRLFTRENPGDTKEGESFKDFLNPSSLEVLPSCRVEPGLANVAPGYRCQFERLGYFCADPDSEGGKLVFNRIVTLRDAWAKIQKAEQSQKSR